MEKANDRQGTNEVTRNDYFLTHGGQVEFGRDVRRRVYRPRPPARRFLPLGLILLVIVLASVAGTAIGGDEPEVPAFEEFLVIPQRNMFSSRRCESGKSSRHAPERSSAPTTAPVGIEVIGIVKTDDRLSSIAIIKDHGRHIPCRVGDRVGDMLITEIRSSEIFFETEAGTRIARLQPGVMSDRVRPEVPRTRNRPTPVLAKAQSSAGRRVPINAMQIRHLAQALPLVTHREAGQVKGLRLTRDIMGLHKGDRVTAVGGQSLHTKYPKQKLLQITRKYRQYQRNVPEIPVVVERGDEKLKLVLVPTS
jgi:hypothetical protein